MMSVHIFYLFYFGHLYTGYPSIGALSCLQSSRTNYLGIRRDQLGKESLPNRHLVGLFMVAGSLSGGRWNEYARVHIHSTILGNAMLVRTLKTGSCHGVMALSEIPN